jgi:hypothetical protein
MKRFDELWPHGRNPRGGESGNKSAGLAGAGAPAVGAREGRHMGRERAGMVEDMVAVSVELH